MSLGAIKVNADGFLPPLADKADDPGILGAYSSVQEVVLERIVELASPGVDWDDSGLVEVAPPADDVETPYVALLEL